MRITGVEIENFGPHAHKKFTDTDYPLICLTGENGSGKSNFLKALELGLTGKAGESVEEPLDSFIKLGSDKATVKLWLSKGGKTGSITRVIHRTSTNKRELVWDGKTYKKDSDVRAALNEILGVDECVLQNVVFIPQGQMDKVLFGTPTEREELFIKMMMMGKMAKVADAADTRASNLSKTISDLGGVASEIRSNHEKAETDLAVAEKNLKATPDVSEHISQWRRVCKAADDVQRYDSIRSRAASELKEMGETLAAALKVSGCASLDDLSEKVNQEKERLEGLQELERSIDASIKHMSKLENYRQSARDFRVKLQEILERFAAAYSTKALEAISAKVESSSERATALRRAYTIYNDIASIEAKMAGNAKTLSDMQAAQVVQRKECDDLYKESTEIEAVVSSLSSRLDIIQRAIKATKDDCSDKEQCPVCGQDIESGVSTLEAKVEDCMQLLEEAYGKKAVVSAASVKANDKLSKSVNDIARLNAHVNAAEQQISKLRQEAAELGLDNTPSEDEVTKAEDDATYISDYYGKAKAACEEYARISVLLQQTEETINTFGEPPLPPEECTEEKMSQVSEDISKCRHDIQGMERCRDNIRDIASKMESLANEAARAKDGAEQASKSLDDEKLLPLTANIVSRVTSDGTVDPVDKDETRKVVMSVLEDMSRERSVNEGIVSEAKRNADEALRKLKEIELREEENAKTLKVVEELRAIKEAFGRKGIPRSYVAYHYDRLVEQANSILASMSANFSISSHPEKTATLLFCRTDKSDGGAMNQVKLSGGQKVRTSMAFLLAMQGMLASELGFLCLDEPSMHIHTEGQEAMKSMLMEMSKVMANGDAQIWVSDHSPIIASACDLVLHFDPLEG